MMYDIIVNGIQPNIDLCSFGSYRFILSRPGDFVPALETMLSPEGYLEGLDVDWRVYYIDGHWLFQWTGHDGKDSESWKTIGVIEFVR